MLIFLIDKNSYKVVMKIVKVICCWNTKIGFASTGTSYVIRPFPLHLIYLAEDSEEGQNSREQHSRDPSV